MDRNSPYSYTVDRISQLPDEILVDILSYLKTKEAVATCILSKRWQHLWTLTLDFEIDDYSLVDYEKKNGDNCISKCRSFKDYVDNVIFSHCGSNLRECSLNFRSKCVAPNIVSWISAVTTSHVQELSILYRNESMAFHHLPCRLFTCKTLVVLGIYGCFVLDIPTKVCFPSLKVLTIENSIFVDDASAERLFSSCPVLQKLWILRAKGFLQTLNISNPSLKILLIRSNGGYNIQVVINTPCLESLEISGFSQSKYTVNFPSSIVRARLGYGYDVSLLNKMIQVNHLSLLGNSRSLRNIISNSGLPKLKKLVTMEYLPEGPYNWKLLPYLLHCSPNLQVLYIIEVLGEYSVSRNVNWREPDSVPGCLDLHLKKIEIFQFSGLREAFRVVRYLLESAKVLEKMIIHTGFHKRYVNEETKSEVLSYKRRSSTCEVIFTE